MLDAYTKIAIQTIYTNESDRTPMKIPTSKPGRGSQKNALCERVCGEILPPQISHVFTTARIALPCLAAARPRLWTLL